MRDSNRPRLLVAAAVLVVGALAIACSGAAAAPTLAPTAAPTPTPTPNPHLVAPASVDAVFTWLNGHDLLVVGNNADRGASGEPVKRINATYAGWPLVLSEYSTAAAAGKASGLGPKSGKPRADQAPFTWLGLNVVVDFGPRLRTDGDPPPDPRFVDAATRLGAQLDLLLGPLAVRSAVRVTPATPAPSGASTAPTKGTPKPSG